MLGSPHELIAHSYDSALCDSVYDFKGNERTEKIKPLVYFSPFNILFCVLNIPIMLLLMRRRWGQRLQTRSVVQRLVQRSTETSAHAGGAEAARRHQGQMREDKDFDRSQTHCKVLAFTFNALSRLNWTSERLRWPAVHSADVPAAVRVCGGSAEDQQGHGAAEKWDVWFCSSISSCWRNDLRCSSSLWRNSSFHAAIDYIHFLHKEKKKQEEEVSVLRKEVMALKIMKTWAVASSDFTSSSSSHCSIFMLGGRFKMIIWDWTKFDWETLTAQPETVWGFISSQTIQWSKLPPQ